jgi:alpha-beta hydrolase superfamily lysophospholipase
MMTEEHFKGVSDFNFVFRSWRPPGKPRGVIVTVPGFN